MLSHSYQSRLKVGTCQSLVLWQFGFYRPMFLLKVQVIMIHLSQGTAELVRVHREFE